MYKTRTNNFMTLADLSRTDMHAQAKAAADQAVAEVDAKWAKKFEEVKQRGRMLRDPKARILPDDAIAKQKVAMKRGGKMFKMFKKMGRGRAAIPLMIAGAAVAAGVVVTTAATIPIAVAIKNKVDAEKS